MQEKQWPNYLHALGEGIPFMVATVIMQLFADKSLITHGGVLSLKKTQDTLCAVLVDCTHQIRHIKSHTFRVLLALV
jgi:hypothetical protein